MKKLFALLMAVSFILTFSVPAFAEDEAAEEFGDMFKNDLEVTDKDGNTVTGDTLVGTGMIIGDGTGIIVLGEVK